MSQREVYLGSFEAGVLYVSEQILRRSNAELDDESDLFRLFCTTLMQAGAQRFVLPGADASAFTASTYLQARISTNGHKEADKKWIRVKEIFDRYLKNKDNDSAEYKAAVRLQYLASDVVRALEAGTSLALVAPMPDMAAAAKILPPDIVVPFNMLLSSMVNSTSSVPVPKATILKSDVAILSKLLQSDIYDQYCVAHKQLEHNDVPISKALSEISKWTSRLQEVDASVSISNRLITLLPLTSKLVDELGGKVAGAVAEAILGPVENWLQARSRLIVYRFDSVLTTLVSLPGVSTSSPSL